MTTECIPHQLEFQGMTRRTVVASFDGDTLSSDGGVLLLAEVDRRLGLLEQFAAFSRTIAIRTWWSIAWRS
jgi:Transposase DDE domain group 1